MSKHTFIPMVYLIDDRPSEEATASANTVEGVAAFKQVMPDLHEVDHATFKAMEQRIKNLAGKEAKP